MGSNYLIGEFCSFVKGASVPRDRMFGNGSWKYLHYGDLYKGHELYIDIEKPTKPIPFISDEERIKSNQFVSDGDIVYVLTSETIDDLGKALMIKGGEGEEIVAGTETTVMCIENRDIANPAYINYMLQTELFKRKLRQYVTGMKVFRVHPRDIAKIEVNLPDIVTQNKVVRILDAIYEKCSNINRLNDYLEELALSLYIEKLEWPQDELPTGWLYKPLSDFFPVKTGKKDANIATPDGTYPFFTCAQGNLLTDDYSFDGTAILVAGNGDFNVKWYEGKFEVYQRTYVLMPQEPALLGYLYCAVKRNLTSITCGARGSVIKFITKGNIADYKIAVPPNPSDNEYVQKLRLLLKTIDANKKEIAALTELRDTLLPKLMSGEIDVSKVLI